MRLRPLPLALLAACGPLATKEVSLSSADLEGHAPITAVDAAWGTGDLTIAARTGSDEVEADVVLSWRGAEPEATLDVADDGVARLGNTCADATRACASDFDVVAAPGPLTVDVGTGDVTVVGGFGPTDVKVGTGDVDVSIVPGLLALDTGTGTIRGSHVAATAVDLRVGTGDVDVAFDEAQEAVEVDVGSGDVHLRLSGAPGELLAFVGTGTVRLELPAGSYALDLTTGTGEIVIEGVVDDPTASSRVRVSVGTGDVTVVATP